MGGLVHEAGNACDAGTLVEGEFLSFSLDFIYFRNTLVGGELLLSWKHKGEDDSRVLCAAPYIASASKNLIMDDQPPISNQKLNVRFVLGVSLLR